MKRLALLITVIMIAVVAGLVHSRVAQAAANCGTHTAIVEQATSETIVGNEIAAHWDVQCNINYRVKLVLQYTDPNGWHTAGCQNNGFGPPCPGPTRPSSGWFNGLDEHQGNELWFLWRPGDICNNHQFRVEMVFTFQNGAGGITWIPGGSGIGC